MFSPLRFNRMAVQTLSKTKASRHWNRIGVRHHHGICVPLSALHDENTGGIGDFGCLPSVIDWCADVGMDVLQLLPIYDTARYKSPYNLNSAFALNPVYLDVNTLATSSERKKLKDLNSREWIAYTEVRKAKLTILWREFKKKKPLKKSAPSWLKTYAKEMGGGNFEEENFHLYLQELCYSQMKNVKRYAEKKGVLLKGDLPILIAPSSVDCKVHPELFFKSLSAGAPPDAFSAEGQNWHFPVYDYERSLPEIKQWWEERLAAAEELFHLYRIDHAVGFFRMWAIEKGRSGKEGSFIPKSPKRWYEQGDELFADFLRSSSMLPIAEDLGTVPLKVKQHLLAMGVPGTKVLRWEKIHPKNYPACSMTTVSTHDTHTLKGWWEAFPKESQVFCKRVGILWKKRLDQKTHWEVLKLAHHSGSLFHINLLQEYFPLVEGLGWGRQEHERVNVPGNTRAHNWLYRFKPSVAAITSNLELLAAIQDLSR